MTTEVGWAGLGIIPTFDKFGRELDQGTSKHMAAAGRSSGKTFGGTFSKAAKAGVLGGIAITAGALKLGSDAIGEAREAQKVGRLTNAVIKSTGGAARVSEKHVGRLSEKLSVMAGVDDELVQSGANVLLTFTKIRNEAGKGNKIFDEATLATLNMSAALKTDLQAASIQVGKALNDPIKGVTALGRAGVQFTEQQKDQIKTLVKSGDTLGAQKIILGELNTQFKGAAASQADSSDRLAVAWGNTKEALGEGLLPVVEDFSKFLLDKGVPAAEKFTDWFNDKGIPAIRDFGDDVRPLAKSVLPAMGTALGVAADALKVAAPKAKALVDAFNDMPAWAQTAIVGGGGALVLGSKIPRPGKGGGGALGGGLLRSAKPVPVFVTNPGFGGAGDLPGGGKAGKAGKWGRRLGTAAAVAAGVDFLADPLVNGDAKTIKGAQGGGALGIGGARGDGIGDAAKKFDLLSQSIKTTSGNAQDFRGNVFGLTPKVEGLGVKVDGTSKATRRLADNLHGLPASKTTEIKTPGLLTALQRAGDYRQILSGIPGYKRTTLEAYVAQNYAGTSRGMGDINREHGGPVTAGRPYIVGEKRAEVFVPRVNGDIRPDASSVGGVTVNVGTVVAQDYGDFMGQMFNRARRASDGGLP